MNIVIVTFYHFFDFPHFEQMREPLLRELNRLGIKGSLLIAPEGLNSTLAGTRNAVDEFLSYLQTSVVKDNISHKESLCDHQPFGRAKVRLKKETISLGEPTNVHATGIYVEPKDWNTLIDDPNTIILDTRNAYEVHLGTFERALDPGIRTFKQLPDYVRKTLDPKKHSKVATFCTGGIRCEKFTSWMTQQGFKEVYHLKGGILKYLEEIPQAESKWRGECYVFDERIAVGHQLEPSQTASRCTVCDHTLTLSDQESSEYIKGKKCPHCSGAKPH